MQNKLNPWLLTRFTETKYQLAHFPILIIRYVKNAQHLTHLRFQEINDFVSHCVVGDNSYTLPIVIN